MDVLNLAAAFADLAGTVGAAMGAPFYDGVIVSQASPGSYNDDGIFIPGSPPTERACKVQIDSADWVMTQSKGYVEGMVRFIVLSAILTGSLDTDAEITVASGPHAGRWLVSSLQIDPAAIGYVGRGLKAA